MVPALRGSPPDGRGPKGPVLGLQPSSPPRQGGLVEGFRASGRDVRGMARCSRYCRGSVIYVTCMKF